MDMALGSSCRDGDGSGSIREYNAGATNLANTSAFSDGNVIINQTIEPTSALANGACASVYTVPAHPITEFRFKSMPSSSSHFVGREGYIDDLKDYFKERSGKNLPRRTMVLHGLGGAGKTQIALEFIEENKDLFWETFWIDASSEETIKASLSAIASNPIAKQAGIEAHHESILTWLAAHRDEWLLVSDGADDDPSVISPFLPASNRGNVLISTRNPNMASIAGKAVEIMDMSPPEAATLLLKSALPNVTSYSLEMEEQAAAIAEELCFMPLAIDQAGAAIRSGCALLSDYLALFKKQRNELSVDPTFKGQSKYDYALYTTWDISFGAIFSSDEPASTIAISIIRTISFMHWDGIAEEFFRRAALCEVRPRNHEDHTPHAPIPNPSLLNNILSVDSNNGWDPLVFREGMRILLSYSFVKPTKTSYVYTMHRLVHAWVRDRMSAEEQTLSIQSIRSVFEWSLVDCDLEDNIGLCRAITPHVIIHFELVQEHFPLWNRSTEVSDALLFSLGMLFRTMGHYRTAMGYLQDALELEERNFEPDQTKILRIRALIASTYQDIGEPQDAKELQKQVLDARRKFLGPDHPDTLSSMNNLASIYSNLGQYQDAKELEEQVVHTRRKWLGPDHPITLTAMNNLAMSYRDLGEYKKANKSMEQVLDARVRLLGPDHPNTVSSMGNLASTYRDLGEYQRAKELMEQVVEARRRLLGPDHPNTVSSMGNLASTYRDLGEYQRARELMEQVVEARRRLLGPDHLDTVSSMGNLASTYRDLGEYPRAKASMEQVLDARRRLLGPDHLDTVSSMGNLAATYSDLGEHKRARELEEQVLGARRRLLGPDHPDTVSSMGNLASTYRGLGENERAKELMEQVVGAQRKLLGSDHPITLFSLNKLISIYQSTGQYQIAKELQEQVPNTHKALLDTDQQWTKAQSLQQDLIANQVTLRQNRTSPSESMKGQFKSEPLEDQHSLSSCELHSQSDSFQAVYGNVETSILVPKNAFQHTLMNKGEIDRIMKLELPNLQGEYTLDAGFNEELYVKYGTILEETHLVFTGVVNIPTMMATFHKISTILSPFPLYIEANGVSSFIPGLADDGCEISWKTVMGEQLHSFAGDLSGLKLERHLDSETGDLNRTKDLYSISSVASLQNGISRGSAGSSNTLRGVHVDRLGEGSITSSTTGAVLFPSSPENNDSADSRRSTHQMVPVPSSGSRGGTMIGVPNDLSFNVATRPQAPPERSLTESDPRLYFTLASDIYFGDDKIPHMQPIISGVLRSRPLKGTRGLSPTINANFISLKFTPNLNLSDSPPGNGHYRQTSFKVTIDPLTPSNMHVQLHKATPESTPPYAPMVKQTNAQEGFLGLVLNMGLIISSSMSYNSKVTDSLEIQKALSKITQRKNAEGVVWWGYMLGQDRENIEFACSENELPSVVFKYFNNRPRDVSLTETSGEQDSPDKIRVEVTSFWSFYRTAQRGKSNSGSGLISRKVVYRNFLQTISLEVPSHQHEDMSYFAKQRVRWNGNNGYLNPKHFEEQSHVEHIRGNCQI